MPILNIKTDSIGESGQTPRIIYITTNDTKTTVQNTGYLDKIVSQGISLSDLEMALVATKESINSHSFQVDFYTISRGPSGYTLSLIEASNVFPDGIKLVNEEGNFILIEAPATGLTNTTYILPDADTAGVLTSDGAGNLSWESVAGTGTVTSISAGTGLTASPNPITATGTISLASTAVSAGAYSFGNGGFTVDAQGRITAAANATNLVTSVSGTAGNVSSTGGTTPVINLLPSGVLAGNYANPNLSIDIYGRITTATTGGGGTGTVTTITAGTGITCTPNPITATGTVGITPSGVTSGTYTNSTIVVNSSGQVTNASSGTPPVLSVVGSTGNVSSSGGQNPVIDLISTGITSGSYTTPNLSVDVKGRITAISSTTPVLSVTATSPVSATAGQNPVISLNDSGITPGSYTSANLTVSSKGIITAISNGGGGGVTSVSGTAGQIISTGSPAVVLSLDNSVVNSVTTGTAGTDFSGSISAHALTLNLPSASTTARGAITTGTQTIGGAKTVDGSLAVTKTVSPVATTPFSVTNTFTSGSSTVSTMFAPNLPNGSAVSSYLGYQDADLDSAISSFNKIGSEDTSSYHLTTLRGATFGAHTTAQTMRFGKTGTGTARGVGRTGLDGFDGTFPAFEFATEDTSMFPIMNLTSNVPPTGFVAGFQGFSTYDATVTDGINVAAAIYATADSVSSGSLTGSLYLNANQNGSVNPIIGLRGNGTIYVPTIMDNGGTTDFDEPVISGNSTYTPTYSNLTNVTSVTKKNGMWTRVGNVFTCVLKLDVLIPIQAVINTASFEITKPTTGGLVSDDDVVGLANSNGLVFVGAVISGVAANGTAKMSFRTLINIAPATYTFYATYTYVQKEV